MNEFEDNYYKSKCWFINKIKELNPDVNSDRLWSWKKEKLARYLDKLRSENDTR